VRGSLARLGVRYAGILPALAAVAVLVAWARDDGGFAAVSWYPGAVLILALLAVAVVGLDLRPGALPRPALVACVALGAFTAWSYLSISWADAKGTAWDGANRTLLYLLLFTLFAATGVRGRRGAIVVGTWTLAIGALAVWVLLDLPDPSGGRRAVMGPGLVYPTGYSNSNAALWLMAAWPALVLASRRQIHPTLRAAFAFAVVVLAETALLSESRGSLVAAAVTGVVLLAAVPERVRTLVTLAPIAAGIAAVTPRVLDVADALQGHPEAVPRLGTIARPVLGAALLVGVVVGSGALAETLLRPSARLVRNGRRVIGSVAIALAVAGAVGGAIAIGDPGHRARTAWHDFKQASAPPGERHLTAGFGGARYDYYRVMLDVFAEHPLAGIGVDNFAQDYLARGRAIEAPTYPHSVELRALVQTGVVGAVLLVIALGAALVGAWRSMTGRRGVEAAAAAAAVLAFVHWFVQGSADWFWEFPALGGAAFAMLGLACASARPAGAARRGSPATARIVVATLAGAGLGVAAVSLVFPWLAAIEVHRAQSSWAVSPPAAYRQLELAEDLNPLSPQAAVTSGTIALRVGDTNRAVRAFRRALDREPRNAYAVLELGAIASARGERPQALSLLRRAAALNPQDFITQGALDAVRAGKRVDVGAMNQQMVDQARDLLR
jgi:hypothetical protein